MDISVLAYVDRGAVAFLGEIPNIIKECELSGEDILDMDQADTSISGLYKIEGTLVVDDEGYPTITDFIYKKQRRKGELIAVYNNLVLTNIEFDDEDEEEALVNAYIDKPNGLYQQVIVQII